MKMQNDMNSPVVTVKTKSAGQLFKEKFGYSKTMKRLLKKYEVSLEEYKKIRKERKKKQLIAKQEHHKLVQLKGSSKGSLSKKK